MLADAANALLSEVLHNTPSQLEHESEEEDELSDSLSIHTISQSLPFARRNWLISLLLLRRMCIADDVGLVGESGCRTLS